MMNRSSGILLHITSLPSPYGVGNLGKAAYDFVDFLKKAGQSYWQILPICPPGYGDSPYQAFSTFAGNPYLIDPDQLVAAGWLTQEELDGQSWGENPAHVDYALLYETRLPIGADLFVKRAFRAAKQYPKECRAAREDIERRMVAAICEWRDAK